MKYPLKKARTGVHINLSAHHVLALRGRVDDLAGRIRMADSMATMDLL